MLIQWHRPSDVSNNPGFRQEVIISDDSTPNVAGGSITKTIPTPNATDLSYTYPVTIGHSYSVAYAYYCASGSIVDGCYNTIPGYWTANSTAKTAIASTYPQPPVLDGSASAAGIDASGNAFITLSMSFPNDGYADLNKTFIKIFDSSNLFWKQTIVPSIPTQITKASANTPGVYEKFTITYDSSNAFPGLTLVKGVEYQIAVDTANINGSSAQPNTVYPSFYLTPTTAVLPPTNISLTPSTNTDTSTFVKITWNHPIGTFPSGYNIYRYTSGTDVSDNAILVGSNVSGTSFTDTNSLKIGKTYYYQLGSLSSTGQMSHLTASSNTTVKASLPAATGFTVTETSDGSFNLLWNPITDASSGPATYTIGYDKGVGTTVQIFTTDFSNIGATTSGNTKPGTQVTATVAGSTAGKLFTAGNYVFTVYGNITDPKFGSTADSLPATASVTYYTPPASFTSGSAKIYASGVSKSVDISFNSPATTSRPITSFLIYGVKRADISNNDIIAQNLLLTISAFADKYSYYSRLSLSDNGTWSFAIVPTNNGYTNPLTLDITNSFSNKSVTSPASRPDANSATVAWDLSNARFSFNITDPTGATPGGYYVGLISDTTGSDLSNIAVTPPVQLSSSGSGVYTCASGVVSNLFTTKNVRNLSFRVDASYSSGYSSGIRANCTAYKRTDLSYNANLTAEVGVSNSVTFDWSPLTYVKEFSSIVTGYKLDISHNDNSTGSSYSLGNVTTYTASVANNTIYKARITPVLTNYEANAISPIPINVNTLDVSKNTVVFKPYTQAGQVTNLVAKYNGTDASGRTVDLSWNAPATSTGITCASFNIYVDGIIVPASSNGLTNKNYDAASTNVSNVTISKTGYDVSLNTGTKYTFGVISVDASSQEVGTMSTVVFAPLRPLDTVASASLTGISTNGNITLSWSPVTLNDGYSNLQYNIYQTKVGSGITTKLLVATVSSSPLIISTDVTTLAPLVSGTSYSYSISAMASTVNGDTRSTTPSVFPTIKCNSSAPAVTSLLAQTGTRYGANNVDGTPASDTDVVNISWINPSSQSFSDASFSKYLVKLNNRDISNNLYNSTSLFTQSTNTVDISYGGLSSLFSDAPLVYGNTYPVSVQIITDASAGGVINASSSFIFTRALVLSAINGLTFTSTLNANGTYTTLVNIKVNANGSSVTNGIIAITPTKFVSGEKLVAYLNDASNPSNVSVKFFNATGDLVSNGTSGAYDLNHTQLMYAQVSFTTVNVVTATPLYVIANGNGLISNLTNSAP